MPTPTATRPAGILAHTDEFVRRHVGPSEEDVQAMLELLGCGSLGELVDQTVPAGIRLREELRLPEPASERAALREIAGILGRNEVWRSYLGMGYHGTTIPPVIQRGILENPGWYTQYTPYQAEISQGRLEALLVFQTMVADLTGMEIANASLLDEATAAAEAMSLCFGAVRRADAHRFLVASDCHPQTIEVVRTRAAPLGIEVEVGDPDAFEPGPDVAGVLVQSPATDGRIRDLGAIAERAHAAGALVVVATDLLALTLLEPPGALGADVVVGNTQRFGVPLGYGGPHAAFLATSEAHKRQVPGRIVGLSRDRHGNPGLRLALQTREQHIRREKATSNICTAQVLLAITAAMYAVYHGPDGLRRIAARVHRMATVLEAALVRLGLSNEARPFFDTLRVPVDRERREAILRAARERRINLRLLDERTIVVALDETVTARDLQDLVEVFAGGAPVDFDVNDLAAEAEAGDGPGGGGFAPPLARTRAYLEHPVFHRHRSETELLRYIHRLQARDLSLTTSMIPLGSCTMKLNATAEMLPVTWDVTGGLHPFAPRTQAAGYQALFEQLEGWLAEITGFAAVSLQPNAGSQGEYAGMLVIRAWHASRGEGGRNVCLIPESAHGTNPASAVMAGMKVVVVACTKDGDVDLDDLERKAAANAKRLAALMITYPSTHGVFEEDVRGACEIVHRHGGQVYLDGANMNAQVGLCRPGDYGADVCHLNLHKTFCIPHGGGGPGMGPIAVAPHLTAFLPGHGVGGIGGPRSVGAVAGAPWGSPSILPIPWVYVRMMGGSGLRRASEVAILNANYMARRLEAHYPVLYRGARGRVAHEFILDLRPLKKTSGVEVEDVAKRLMDYGFHAPTVSFPVPGTLMIEPTESEPKAELDRFCDALIAIREEIRRVEDGTWDRADNPLRGAPHTAAEATASSWSHAYEREVAVFPAPWTREHKFWPPVGRIDNLWGDRNLVCACPPASAYAEADVSASAS